MIPKSFQEAREETLRVGYCLLSGTSVQEISTIATRFGTIVPDARTGVLVSDLRPQPMIGANRNTLSSRYGTGAFPFHTEAAYFSTPPRFLILYCEHPGSGDRPTHLLDGVDLATQIQSMARSGSWIVRAGRPSFLTQVVDCTLGGSGLRFDRACMFPTGRAAQIEEGIIIDFLSAHRAIPIL